MPTRRYTDAQYERMAELREQGRSYPSIAREVGCPQSTVAWICLRLGAVPSRGSVPCKRSTAPIRRGAGVVRPFTDQDDRLLLELEAEGLSLAAIGRRLHRTHNTVQGRLLTLARREEKGMA